MKSLLASLMLALGIHTRVNAEQQHDQAMAAKSVINWLAAFLGFGTFLGFVNLAVGVLSATWLVVQLYGYVAHELPMKRMRKQIIKRELERGRTHPTPLDALEADE